MEHIINATSDNTLEQKLLTAIQKNSNTSSENALREYMIGATGKIRNWKYLNK